MALVGCRINHVRIVGIHRNVSYACELALFESIGPRLSTVCCFIKSTIAAGAPQRPLSGNVNNVTVFRVDQNLPDMLAVLQTNFFKRFAAVG